MAVYPQGSARQDRRPPAEDDGFTWPACGAELPAKAKFCRECGASEEFGWNEVGPGWEEEDEELPGGYSEDDDFDYDRFVEREFPDQVQGWTPSRVKKLLLAILVIALCLSLLLWTCG